ncbi:hypothetical protein AGMMS50222_06980 [Endomicrobiia bacterium]|nr:hypothetical protein AGMMS50222_06980 [Endomicrobiia bacterium]
METIKRKSKMGELLTIMLKTRLEKIAKKVMTAIIVFGMVISPAVNAMADGGDGGTSPAPVPEPPRIVVVDGDNQEDLAEPDPDKAPVAETVTEPDAETEHVPAAAPAVKQIEPESASEATADPMAESNAQAKNELAQGTALAQEDVLSLSSSSDTDSSSGKDSDTDNDSLSSSSDTDSSSGKDSDTDNDSLSSSSDTDSSSGKDSDTDSDTDNDSLSSSSDTDSSSGKDSDTDSDTYNDSLSPSSALSSSSTASIVKRSETPDPMAEPEPAAEPAREGLTERLHTAVDEQAAAKREVERLRDKEASVIEEERGCIEDAYRKKEDAKENVEEKKQAVKEAEQNNRQTGLSGDARSALEQEQLDIMEANKQLDIEIADCEDIIGDQKTYNEEERAEAFSSKGKTQTKMDVNLARNSKIQGILDEDTAKKAEDAELLEKAEAELDEAEAEAAQWDKNVAMAERQANDAIKEIAQTRNRAEAHYAATQARVADELTEFVVNDGDDQMDRDVQEIREIDREIDVLTNKSEAIAREQASIAGVHDVAVEDKKKIEGEIHKIEENLKETKVALVAEENILNNLVKELNERKDAANKNPSTATQIKQGAVKRHKDSCDALKLKYSELSEELGRVNRDLGKADEKKDGLRQQLENMEHDKDQTNNKRDALGHRRKELDAGMETVKDAKAPLELEVLEGITVDADRIKMERYEREIQRQEEIIDNLDRRRVGLKEEFKGLEANIENLDNVRAEIRARMEEIDESSAVKQEGNTNQNKSDKSRAQLEIEEQELVEKLIGLDNAIHDIMERIARTDNSLDKATQELQKYKQKKEEGRNKAVGRNIELKQLRETRGELTEELDIMKDHIAELENELARVREEYSEAQIAIEDRETKLEQARGEVARVQEEVERAHTKAKELQSRLSRNAVGWVSSDLKKRTEDAEEEAERARRETAETRKEAEEVKEENRVLKMELRKRGAASTGGSGDQANERERENEELKKRFLAKEKEANDLREFAEKAQEETERVKEEARKAATLVKEEATVVIVRAEGKTREAMEEIARLNEKNRELQRKLAEREAPADNREAASADESGARATEIDGEKEELRTALNKVKKEAEQAKEEREVLRTAADKAKEESREAQEEVAKEQEEKKELKAALDKANEKREKAEQKLAEKQQGTQQPVAAGEQKNSTPNAAKIVVVPTVTKAGSVTQNQTGSFAQDVSAFD